jgi:hypothetical protein
VPRAFNWIVSGSHVFDSRKHVVDFVCSHLEPKIVKGLRRICCFSLEHSAKDEDQSLTKEMWIR